MSIFLSEIHASVMLQFDKKTKTLKNIVISKKIYENAEKTYKVFANTVKPYKTDEKMLDEKEEIVISNTILMAETILRKYLNVCNADKSYVEKIVISNKAGDNKTFYMALCLNPTTMEIYYTSTNLEDIYKQIKNILDIVNIKLSNPKVLAPMELTPGAGQQGKVDNQNDIF